jgi:hypothetical protein
MEKSFSNGVTIAPTRAKEPCMLKNNTKKILALL